MGLFDKLNEPIFLKESSDALRQLEVLKNLESKLTSEGQALIRQDIRSLEYGIWGENNIEFELRNSHMPMYILRDLYIEDGDLSAQIDYMVFTRKLCFIIECKNLYGDIEINSNGDFIRTVDYNGRKKKEGIYSPITQNTRHMELIRKIRNESRSGFFARLLTEKTFDTYYKSIVVLANPKTVLNDRYAKKDIKNQVIRADQLITFIKDQCQKTKELNSTDSELKSWAESIYKHHKELEKDYTLKYQPHFKDPISENIQTGQKEEPVDIINPSDELGDARAEDTKDEEAAKDTTPVLVCPKCGNELVLRTAKKGENKGNPFYGCSNFPKCRFIQNI